MIKMPRRKQGAQGIAATAAYEAQLAEWCQDVIRLHRDMNLKIGVQEWNYIIEGEGSITKGEFEACEKLISACRKNGKLPISICADDNGRPSTNEEYIDDTSVRIKIPEAAAKPKLVAAAGAKTKRSLSW